MPKINMNGATSRLIRNATASARGRRTIAT